MKEDKKSLAYIFSFFIYSFKFLTPRDTWPITCVQQHIKIINDIIVCRDKDSCTNNYSYYGTMSLRTLPSRIDIRSMCAWDLKDGGNTVEIFLEYLFLV